MDDAIISGFVEPDNDRWKENIPYVSSLLTHDSVKIQAKTLWLLGEMGLLYPQSVQDTVSDIQLIYVKKKSGGDVL